MSSVSEPLKNPTKRSRRGQWTSGISGNPAGRPVGSRNKSTLLLENLLESRQEELINKAIELALNGEPTALKLCIERLLPVVRERRVELTLPTEIKTLGQATDAVSSILSSVAEGQITPGEGAVLTTMVETQKDLIEAHQEEQARESIVRENGKLEAELQQGLRQFADPATGRRREQPKFRERPDWDEGNSPGPGEDTRSLEPN